MSRMNRKFTALEALELIENIDGSNHPDFNISFDIVNEERSSTISNEVQACWIRTDSWLLTVSEEIVDVNITNVSKNVAAGEMVQTTSDEEISSVEFGYTYPRNVQECQNRTDSLDDNINYGDECQKSRW